MEKYLAVGQIINTHGVKGEVKVLPLTDNPTRFDSLKWVYVEKPGGLERYDIEGVKYLKNFVILKFAQIQDVSQAEAHKGLYLDVDRENAVKLPPDSFFISDLVGSRVSDETGKELGVLVDVISTGSNDVYVVKNETGKELLIPALKSVIREVSIAEKKIAVVLPEGLIDDEV